MSSEKKYTLLNLDFTESLIKDWHKLQDELNYYFKKPINLRFNDHIKIFIALPLVTAIITLIIFGRKDGKFIFDVLPDLFSFFFLVIYPLSIFIINRNAIVAKKRKYAKRIQEIPILQKKLFQELKSKSDIPEDYWYLYALEKMKKYINNNRADSLKECINLFEHEEQHYARMRELRNIKLQQEAISSKVDDIATLGWYNLFRR
ncbi:hypothetical protein [Brevibacillus daliensis]|uniref:hypothetical protein n=1 Tax=Brevibacillus daliensis TaxID=2892995 RepID=UPI001E58CA44|nr:hypothetical protein [Brevibacillus daliensis]